MNFLQPAMLYALPIVALPIIIHLINQRRFRTINWGAMMFLLAANRMSRGYARIRQWLILAARTLAVAGLIFAISRPLSSGLLSLAAGGRVDTTIVLLDRSPSMQQQAAGGGRTKLESGREQLVQSLGMLRSNRWVVIDSVGNSPMEIESAAAIANLPQAEGVSSSTDLPAMLQTAYEYVRENRPSRTDIWICSDVRQHDWDSDSGRWQAIRDSFLEFPQPVRIHLLAYAETAPENRRVRVTEVQRVANADGANLLLSLRIEQTTPSAEMVKIPVQLEIDGARTEVTVEMTGGEVDLEQHAVPLDAQQKRGWGRVSIPADANATDNECFFVFDEPAPRKTIIVADEPDSVRALNLAAAISPDPGVAASVELLSPQQVPTADWEGVALLLWQSQLPQAETADAVQAFLGRGGHVVFFPPPEPTSNEFAGLHWEGWQELAKESAVSTWVGDQDLLANVRSGAALPVGQLTVTRYCEVAGESTSLASLSGGAPLLCRAMTDQRNVYFCTTTTDPADSSLARDGVVLYVMIQRALNAGASSLGGTRQFVAGEAPAEGIEEWRRLSLSDGALSTSYAYQAGAYQREEQLFAINRSVQEDSPATVTDTRVAELFKGLPFDRVDEQAGSGNRLLEEIWRLFLAVMMFALLAEAFLCIPRIVNRSAAQATAPGTGSPVRGAAA